MFQILQSLFIIRQTQIQISHVHVDAGLQIFLRVKEDSLAQADDSLLIIPLVLIHLTHAVQGIDLLRHIDQHLLIVFDCFFIMMGRLVEYAPLHQQVSPRRLIQVFRQLRKTRLIKGEISVLHMVQKYTPEFLYLLLYQIGVGLVIFMIGIRLQIGALQLLGIFQIQIHLGHIHIGLGIIGKTLDQLSARLYHAGGIPLPAVSLQGSG